MRLNSIKLAGFKSFAEPTHFQLPGQLVGVVGPNGCGKSNIMDAVRWVLGESKASELRGESMQDVIFNGSGNRKPAGRASVELVFSNEDGRAGGQWNRFAEIAVKRVLSRDGASSYYINNQVVRRRDVQDVFLGTGLGPRAYAIIGQGTISRIIESKPEELRLFLEEAAGVSKYKERRRETENRLRDTRENLTRVQDILRELGGNLERLEAQAEVAGRYAELQASIETRQQQLWFLKHREATREATRVAALIENAVTALEARTAELRHAETALEAIRQRQYAVSDELHAAQGSLAEAALEVSRLEERIRYVTEGRARVGLRVTETTAQGRQWSQRKADAEDELERSAAPVADADRQRTDLQVQVTAHAAELPGVERVLRTAQSAHSEQRNQVAGVQQQIQVLAAERRNLSEQRTRAEARRDKLAAERCRLVAPDLDRLAELSAQRSATDTAAAQADSALHGLGEQVPALDQARRAEQQTVNAETAKEADLRARLGALRALQDKVKTEGKVKPWLARHGLAELPALWTRLQIEAGWESALEAALRERLGALELVDFDRVHGFDADPPPGRIAFHVPPQITAPVPPSSWPRLSDRLRLHDAGLKALLDDWLSGVHTAESLPAALADHPKLAPRQLLITREGHAVSSFAVTFYAPDSEQAGLLARAQEIDNLDRGLRAQQLIAETAHGALARAETAYAQASQQLADARREAADAQIRSHRLQVEWLRLSQAAEQSQTRGTQLDTELAEIDTQQAELVAQLHAAESRHAALGQQAAADQHLHGELGDAVAAAERALNAARDRLRTLERQAQEAEFSARSLAARRAELQRAIDTAVEQITTNQQAQAQLQNELAQLTDTGAPAGLEAALAVRRERESALAAKRSEYDDLTARLRAADEQRLRHEQDLPPLRDDITRLQLEAQAAQIVGAQFFEHLTTAQVDLAVLGAGIEQAGVRLASLQGQIDTAQRQITALGAVNLAALEELTTSRERKTFLDAQNADLVEAMTTLEDAIHKIDLETRDLLGSTFEQVNTHFGRLFPTLFGGGTARLVMTGDEILDAGVQVMAQPPGKKNSTIHLLSGGEKALTAIALVFAIFQLNPAPFCLLDEVDAPLDDANTERYSKLVKEMAQNTQFLFISHNRIAMEMAEQLIGVTMQEQGVSRIVSVDLQLAAGLAEAA